MESLGVSGIIGTMSKPLIIEVPHSLSRDEAKRRIAGGFDHIDKEFRSSGLAKMESNWSEYRMRFMAQAMGQAITGALDVLDQTVRVEVHMPAFLAIIGGGIRKRLTQEAQALLASK